MKKLFVFFLLLSSFGLSSAQFSIPDSLKLSGIVFDKNSLDSLQGTHIILNNSKGTITNQFGQFSFYAHVGDTVSFSFVGYKPVIMKITDSLPGNEFILGIALAKDTLLLSEVIIRPRINYNQFKYQVVNEYQQQSDYVNAKNNLEITKITASRAPKKLDANMIADRKLRSYEQSAMNLGIIRTDPSSGGVNFLALIPLSIAYLSGKLEQQEPELFLKPNEIDFLKEIFRKDYIKESKDSTEVK